MINLLPPETKRQIRAARMNIVLRQYCLLILTTAMLLAGVFGVGWWVTLNDKTAAESAKRASQQASSQYAKTRKTAENFAKDLNVARNILASNISFSDLITDIAAVVPQNVILNNLALTSTAATAPVDISGRAKTPQDAIALKNSLEASPIFENVSISNISQADPATLGQADTLTQQYPVSVTLKVEFSQKAKEKKS